MVVCTDSVYFSQNFGLKIINEFGNLNEFYERQIFEDLLLYKTFKSIFQRFE
jgi:hypothetical protein